MLSKEWTDHPQAREFTRLIKLQITDIKDSWSRGEMTSESMEATLQMNSKWIGVIEGLEAAINILKTGGDE